MSDIFGLIDLRQHLFPDHVDGAGGIQVLENQNLGNGKKDQNKEKLKKSFQNPAPNPTQDRFFLFFSHTPHGNGFYVE